MMLPEDAIKIIPPLLINAKPFLIFRDIQTECFSSNEIAIDILNLLELVS